jgi:hypothetical protein
MPPPPNLTQQLPETQRTQDSLSFPPIDELAQLRASNLDLKSCLASLVEQYYQWKLACILSVDKNRQMDLEFKKIDIEYLENNVKREFGLTSWAHTDELFPWPNIPMKKVNNALSIIDWKNCGWDYENSMSCHNLRVIHRSGSQNCSQILRVLCSTGRYARCVCMALDRKGGSI